MKKGTLLSVIFLLAFAAFHLFRILAGVTVVIGETSIPIWASAIAVLISGTLAGMLWRESNS